MAFNKLRRKSLQLVGRAKEKTAVAYQYQPLSSDNEEIRLITLHQGRFDDPILIGIHHVPLIPLPDPASERLSIEELRATLPEGKYVNETLDGRYIFTNDIMSYRIAWEHPDPSIDRSKYADLDVDRELATIKYEALSYVWGLEPEYHTVDVAKGSFGLDKIPSSESKSQKQTILIRSNLFSALKHLRLKSKKRTLWIDAICIDQENSDERNKQVRRMGRIYGLAHRTIIWLGDGSKETADAFAELVKLAEGAILDTSGFWFCRPNAIHETPQAAAALAMKLEARTLEAIEDLFDRSYFRRLWVCY
jgi:hypothetical protein